MAGGAQRHEVRFIVRAALGQRYDVVNLLRRGDPATLLAPLAQGVGSDETVAHALPHPAVALLHSRVTLVSFVPLVSLGQPVWEQGCLGLLGTRSPPWA